jgi:hypothetical protein
MLTELLPGNGLLKSVTIYIYIYIYLTFEIRRKINQLWGHVVNMLWNTLIGIYSVWFVLIVLIGTNYIFAGFQILTAVNMKCMGFWSVMSYNSERARRF